MQLDESRPCEPVEQNPAFRLTTNLVVETHDEWVAAERRHPSGEFIITNNSPCTYADSSLAVTA